MQNRVVVTGFDLMCSLGKSKKKVWNNLEKGVTQFAEQEKELAYELIGDIKTGKVDGIEGTDELDKSEVMANQMIENALNDAGVSVEDINEAGNHISLSLATSVMGSDRIVRYEKEKNNLSDIALSKEFVTKITKKFHIGGGAYTTSSACASGTAAMGIAFDLIKEGRADTVICGGSDHLTSISLFGFKALQTLTSGICKPFDQKRDGINIGEGAAFFIVESYEHAIQRKANIYGEIMAYSLANDAYHITSPDPNGKGASFAMKSIVAETLKNDAMNNELIYINAHGTGTTANDAMESKAISKVFEEGKFKTVVSSTKSLTGHCLGAAGSIEFGLSLMMLAEEKLFPTRNSETDIAHDRNYNEEIDNIVKNNIKVPKYFISNSFAFGGNDASIMYKSYRGEDDD